VTAVDTEVPDVPVAEDGTRWSSGRRRILLSALAGAAAIAVLACAVVATTTYLADRSRESHREALVEAAGDGVLALIDVHTDTAEDDMAQLREWSTGAFAQELGDSSVGLAASIRDAAVNSDGRIDSAALVSESGESGVVIVAASSQVGNVDSPTATSRSYRLRVTIDEVDGRLLMSGVEFVP
jgi:Mce-associated membrane protein